MTIDKQEIKAMALACEPARCADEAEEDRRLCDFYSECGPEVVLALLAEIERLERDAKNDAIAYKAAIERQEEIRQERDQLKAENEALRKDAERYQWLRSRDLETISQGGVFAGITPQNMVLNEETLDQAVDSAMAREDRP